MKINHVYLKWKVSQAIITCLYDIVVIIIIIIIKITFRARKIAQ